MYPLWPPYSVLCKTSFLSALKGPTMRHLVSLVVLRSVSPVDGWTIAFQANGPQGAWTTLWTGVDGPKRQPAHCPDHRDCPHPRAFAHAPHRAKGVTGSPYRVFMVTVTVNQEAGQRLRRGPRLRGSVSNGGLPTPLLHNTKSIHTRRARVGDKTILKQRLTLAAVRVE